MATQKHTTNEIMDIFFSAKNNVEKAQSEINEYKTLVNKRLSILKHQFNYAMHTLNEEQLKSGVVDNKIILSQAEKRGSYDSYGLTVHPKFATAPRDIFNIKTTTGYIFKNNISATINGVDYPEIIEAIKHDSINDKEFSIKSYNTNTVTIVITPDQSNSLGSLNTNLIEIEPFLPGSFNIESLELYSAASGILPEQTIEALGTVGRQRIIFDIKTQITKVVMRIRLLYQDDTGWYPFGLKHLYFYDADFRDDSYMIVRIDKSKNISYIYDNITIKNQFGTDFSVSCTDEDIEFYSNYDSEIGLNYKIELSLTDSPSYIATNIKTCFAKIPITTAMIAITPDVRTD